MISTQGMLTVAEAAKKLRLSTEQVRRRLREGKLKGQRIGNQWFIEGRDVAVGKEPLEPLIPVELMDEIERGREETYKRTGIIFDIVRELREDRDSH